MQTLVNQDALLAVTCCSWAARMHHGYQSAQLPHRDLTSSREHGADEKAPAAPSQSKNHRWRAAEPQTMAGFHLQRALPEAGRAAERC